MNVTTLLGGSGLPAAEARALLAHVLNVRREHLVAHPDRAVDPADAERFSALVRQRHDAVPLAYLLGSREFYGRPFEVTPAVLVPRPETELLVDLASQHCKAERARVVDLGTGSGCIAITLALEHPRWDVQAVDRSADALAVARANAAALGATVTWHTGDWLAPLDAQRFDLIVSNPPYVAPGDPHLADLRHEPLAALVADGGALHALAAIIATAPAHLVPGGLLLLEHGYDQGEAVRSLLRERGFSDVGSHLDSAGIERVARGRWAG